MKRVLAEIFTIDNALHLLLWIGVLALVEWPLWLTGDALRLSPVALSGPVAATLVLFAREVAQIRTSNKYRSPKTQFTLHKHLEWIAPSVAGCAIKGVAIAII